MTFPEALRTLAQLRPERFKVKPHFPDRPDECIVFTVQMETHVDWWPLDEEDFTQDDLDSILLVLDRRVLLRESITVTGSSFNMTFNETRVVRLVATIFDAKWNIIRTVETDEIEKNPAMRKALVAVVEGMKGESNAR